MRCGGGVRGARQQGGCGWAELQGEAWQGITSLSDLACGWPLPPPKHNMGVCVMLMLSCFCAGACCCRWVRYVRVRVVHCETALPIGEAGASDETWGIKSPKNGCVVEFGTPSENSHSTI